MPTDEAVILQMVQDGVFSIDAEGRIWRQQYFSRASNPRPILPKRAEKVRPDGYARVWVTFQGVEYSALAHRVVWQHFNGPIPDGHEINHKDGQRSNNHPRNLEALTPGQNLEHAYRVLGRQRPTGERNPHHKLTWEDVAAIRSLHATGASGRSLARQYGVAPIVIREICRGQSWQDNLPLQQRSLQS